MLSEEYLKPLNISFEVPSRGLLTHLIKCGQLTPNDFYITKENKYQDLKKLEEDINSLKDFLMEQITCTIYDPAIRSTIKREMSTCFNTVYDELDKLVKSLPHIDSNLRDKPSTSGKLEISGTIKTK